MYHVYILRCADGSLYTVITNDLKRRLAQHKDGKGGHYTKAKGAQRMVYSETALNRGAALRREAEIKRWTREQKFAFIRSAKKGAR